MKKLLTILLICINTFCYAQNLIPKIEYHGQTEKVNKYVKILRLKDKDALILKVGYSGYWIKGIFGKYIVYLNDGKVRKYEVYDHTT